MEPQACVLAMVVDKDARNPDAKKVLRVEQHTAKLTEAGGGVSIWVVLRVLRVKQTTALPMAEEDAVDILKGARKLREVSQASALSTVGERGVKLKVAHGAPRGRLVFASRMAEDGVVNSSIVIRGLKEAQCFVKHTGAESAACSRDAQKERREVLHYAKGPVEESVVCLMVVAYVQKAYMEVQTFAWHMVVGRGVQLLVVPRVPVGRLIVA